MADTQDLSFMFEEPMSPSEQLFESNTSEKQEEKNKQLLLKNLTLYFQKLNKTKKANESKQLGLTFLSQEE